MKVIKIYLASGTELVDDRVEFGNLIRRLDEIYERRGVRIKLIEADSEDESEKKIDESGKCIGESDMFLALFHLEAGRYTVEEFNRATEEFKLHSSPKVYAYMKSVETGEEETEELKGFKHHLLEEIGHYWCKYKNTDTMQLHFVMQLQLLESHPSVELKIKDEKALLDGEEVADLSKVPFVSLNKGFQKLKEEIEELDEDLADIQIDLKEEPDNERKRAKLLKKSERRNVLAKELEQTQEFLFQTAMKFNSLMGRSCTRRIIKAKELLDDGKAEEANAVLNIDDIDRDAEINIKAYEQAKEDLELKRENVIKSIEEYTVKARTVMTDSSIPNMSERCDQACDAYKKAIDLGKRVDYDKGKLAEIWFDYAELLGLFNRIENSIYTYNESLSICRKLTSPNNYESLIHIADILNNLGLLYAELNNLDIAEKQYKEALKITKKIAKAKASYCFDVAVILDNLIEVHCERNEYKLAEREGYESLKLKRSLLNNDVSSYQLAITLNNLGALHYTCHRLKKAEEEYGEALQIRERLALKFKDESMQYDLYQSLMNLGCLHTDIGKLELANKELLKAEHIITILYARNPEIYSRDLAFYLNNISSVHTDCGKYKKAIKECERALEIYKFISKQHKGIYLNEIAWTLFNLAGIESALNLYPKSMAHYNESLKIFKKLEKVGCMNAEYIAEIHFNMAVILEETGCNLSAEKYYIKSLSIRRVLLLEDKENFRESFIKTLFNLGDLYLNKLHFYNKSEQIFQKLIKAGDNYSLTYLRFVESLLMQNKFKKIDKILADNYENKDILNIIYDSWRCYLTNDSLSVQQKEYIDRKIKIVENYTT